ncbi:hypothetical protein FGO68_gene14682 [Halteria grandinella]|uniref:SNF2 N-terminal domain-containing protein n=1 Tax=Halteria grandinella TaxID=5974 RepID=A0A8J8P267_HALGN|nr:hypothetical protein FGO68_gene14682 [Halteria grandinella]
MQSRNLQKDMDVSYQTIHWQERFQLIHQGLGKKLVAIALSIIYKPEWPLLIICPFVLRHAWQEEFVRWIPNIKLEYIQVFGSSTAETLNPAAKIYIISYQLITHEVVLKRFEERGFKLAIVDQASYLKCHDSDWSQALLPFLFALRRVIMLAGSNFQENPLEIYNLLKVIRPDYMPDFLKFCMRYADPLKRPDGVEFIGRSFSHELSQLFRKRFALRRTRDDENIEVESFTRQKIEISGVQGIVKGVLQEINEGPFAQYEEAHPG